MADEKQANRPGAPGRPAPGPDTGQNRQNWRQEGRRDERTSRAERPGGAAGRGGGARESFTDAALAREVEDGKFQRTPPGQTDSRPSVDRNPYNFVRLPTTGPKQDAAPSPDGHVGHSGWSGTRGRITFKLVAQTPLFVPEGEDGTKRPEEQRHFFRARRQEQAPEQYAIPGSSLKGALRSMVEAVANDEFGVLNEKEHGRKIPYRRQSRHVGELEERGPGGNGWQVKRKAHSPAAGTDKERRMFLLWWKTFREPYRTEDTNEPPVFLPQHVIDAYVENLQDPHYSKHFKSALCELKSIYDGFKKEYESGNARDPEALRRQITTIRNKYYRALEPQGPETPGPGSKANQEESKKLPEFPQLQKELEDLKAGQEIYFTEQGSEIDSFGKNAYYLWPSKWKVEDLVAAYWPRHYKGLGSDLGIADRLFGFAAPHKKGASHPFQGKVRVRTSWGPIAVDKNLERGWGQETERLPNNDSWPMHEVSGDGKARAVVVKLAPLTSPGRAAKARPQYLVGRNDEESASYSDEEKPELKGRKFYWKQRAAEPEGIWKGHRRSGLHNKVSRQCPPPVTALLGAEFECEVEFENLSQEELGALLFVLRGSGDGKHRIHLGKGRPRGMGVCEATGPKVEVVNEGRYKAWAPGEGVDREWSNTELDGAVKAFLKWAGAEEDNLPAYIQEFLALHRWPDEPSVRYYPLHFRDYGWLPKADVNPDEPDSGRRPKPMKRALECEDEKPQK